MSHRSIKLFASSFVGALALIAADTQAMLITHNTSTVLFSDNFESEPVGNVWNNNAQPGNWLLTGAPLVANAAPGAFEGSQYGFAERNLVDSFDIARAQFTSVNSGRLDLDTMVYIPGTQQFLSILLGNNLASNADLGPDTHAYIVFHSQPNKNVQEANTPTNMATQTPGFNYKNDEWMRLQIGWDYANAASGYTVRLTTTSGSFLYTQALIHPTVAINTMLIKFEDNGYSALFDASPIPEPSCLAFLGAGALMFARRRLA